MLKWLCPHCGRACEAVQWRATLWRTRGQCVTGVPAGPVGEEGTMISVGPGRYELQPCGHEVDWETAIAFAKAASHFERFARPVGETVLVAVAPKEEET